MGVKEYKLKAVVKINIETTLTDAETPTEETIKFLLSEDLQDLGYDLESIEVTDFTIE